jgi:trimeric autotransporter adhesin
VQKVIPEAVTENSKGYLLVNNDPILWAMLNAIKEQQKEIGELKSELRATRQSLRKVKAQVTAAQPALVAAK